MAYCNMENICYDKFHCINNIKLTLKKIVLKFLLLNWIVDFWLMYMYEPRVLEYFLGLYFVSALYSLYL